MLKVIVGIAVVAFTTFCGYFFAKKYRKRQSFYTQWWEFNERFLGEISYYRRPLGEFLSKYTYKYEFGIFLHSYYLALERGEKDLHFLFPDFLNEEEQREAQDYFLMLGKGDSVAQKAYFTAVKESLSKGKTDTTDACKKFGDLYVKLGFLIGLFLLILII